MATDETQCREESDLLVVRKIPAGAYWGVQTLRAIENFEVSLVPLHNYSTLIHRRRSDKSAG